MQELLQKIDSGFDFDMRYEANVGGKFGATEEVVRANNSLVVVVQYPGIKYSHCIGDGLKKSDGAILFHSVKRFARAKGKVTVAVDLVDCCKERIGALVAVPTINALRMIHYLALERRTSNDVFFAFGDDNLAKATKFHWTLRDGRQVVLSPLDVYCGFCNNQGLSMLALKDLATGQFLPETFPLANNRGFPQELYRAKKIVFEKFMPVMTNPLATVEEKESAVSKLDEYLQKLII